MSNLEINSTNQQEFVVINPLPKHFSEIQDLCKRVYPFSKPWSIDQLESHRSYFPDGQFIVIEKNSKKVYGLAFSLIIPWDDYSPQDNWGDFTSGGYFHNHNPKKGKTLYGAEVMVDPEARGRGLGKLLYQARRELADKYKLNRIRAGARLRGYSRFKDELTSYDYTRKVVSGEIYDPTLSFQLQQGFKVIDVAKNYLFNDPESLGYAAVIEWLNPKFTTTKDIENQKKSIESFLNDENFIPEHLPKELRRLVRKTTTTLGNIIKEIEGDIFYKKIEHLRESAKIYRSKSLPSLLNSTLKNLNKESSSDLLKIAHAFSLQLELVNVCESAYRTWRQRQRPIIEGIKKKIPLTFVLTAHPTEARNKHSILALNKIAHLLIDGIENNFVFNSNELNTFISQLWILPLSKIKQPTVIDEAESIYANIFQNDILNFIIEEKSHYELNLCTWVGGDMDGNPFVTKDTFKDSLNQSRILFVQKIEEKLQIAINDLRSLVELKKCKQSEIDSINTFIQQLRKIKSIGPSDGSRVKTTRIKFNSLIKTNNKFIKNHFEFIRVKRIFELYPALVIPLELRESASKITEALKSNSSNQLNSILLELNKISGALSPSYYARGFVISNCESANDIENAEKLVFNVLKTKKIPIIPLFESKDALKNAKSILKQWLTKKRNHDLVRSHWNNHFELMLGYSDSSKQIGALPSRWGISKTMDEVDKFLTQKQIKPLFFHGSGGSVARGGGSLKEQVSWWTNSAISEPKLTIQGEMIQRSFFTKEILNSQCSHLVEESVKRKRSKIIHKKNKFLDNFSLKVENKYRELTESSPTLEILLNASPFKYLDKLKLGSRPNKRPEGIGSIKSLRAIPWVLCWTQTRLLFPTWWGVGSAWASCSQEEKLQLNELFLNNPFFSSFVKTLAFTLEKVELDIFLLYLQENKNENLISEFKLEYSKTVEFILDLTKQKNLLWHRPWLRESIKLRSPQIHILNLIQILSMRRSDENLLTETIVGISCGMLTTG